MNHSKIYTGLLFIVPLLLIGMYALVTFTSDAQNARIDLNNVDPNFVHPSVPGGPTASAGMLRTQPSQNSAGAASVNPTGDNVADSYFHELFVLRSKIAANPSDTLAMRQLGRLLQDGHRMDEAISTYENYLEAHPDNHQVWLDLAASRASNKQWSDAKVGLRKMMEKYPGDESARYNLGAIAANEGKFEEARSVWSDLATQAQDSAVKTMATSSLSRLKQND